MLVVSTHVALAADTTYKVEQVVNDGKDSKETDAVLAVKKDTFTVTPGKEKFKAAGKEFSFSEIKTADYSFSKKPMVSTGCEFGTVFIRLPCMPND